jgi:outer membrane biogenesis lipoprotein LolB
VPDPAQPATEELDQRQQRLQGLTQAGWHIDYTRYVAVGAESLPTRLTLQRDAVRVRLLVDDWQL